MMGYVVCLDGDILRFVSHKTNIYCRYTLTQIQQIGGSVDVSGVRSPLLGGVTALSGEQSASVDNTITSVRGKKLVKIKCEVNPVSDVMPAVSVSGQCERSEVQRRPFRHLFCQRQQVSRSCLCQQAV